MADQLPLFPFTSQEDWYGELVFTSADDGTVLSLAGRTFEMPVTQAVAGAGTTLVAPVRTLTMAPGGGLSLKVGAPNTLVFRVPLSTAQTFARTEYTADVLEVIDGERHVFMPVRISYSDPSGLRAFVSRFIGVAVSFASRVQPIVTPVAIAGRQGAPGATIITGLVPPVPADGRDGDFWIEDRTATSRGRRMYGPKVAGAWPPTPWNIQVAGISDVPGLSDALGTVNDGIAAKLDRTLTALTQAPSATDVPAGTGRLARTSDGRSALLVNDGTAIVDVLKHRNPLLDDTGAFVVDQDGDAISLEPDLDAMLNRLDAVDRLGADLATLRAVLVGAGVLASDGLTPTGQVLITA